MARLVVLVDEVFDALDEAVELILHFGALASVRLDGKVPCELFPVPEGKRDDEPSPLGPEDGNLLREPEGRRSFALEEVELPPGELEGDLAFLGAPRFRATHKLSIPRVRHHAGS